MNKHLHTGLAILLLEIGFFIIEDVLFLNLLFNKSYILLIMGGTLFGIATYMLWDDKKTLAGILLANIILTFALEAIFQLSSISGIVNNFRVNETWTWGIGLSGTLNGINSVANLEGPSRSDCETYCRSYGYTNFYIGSDVNDNTECRDRILTGVEDYNSLSDFQYHYGLPNGDGLDYGCCCFRSV